MSWKLGWTFLIACCLSVCLFVCKLFKCSWPTGPTWGKLSTKHTWRKGIHEGPRPFPRELCSSLFIAKKCFSCMQCAQWTSLSYSIKVKLLYCWNQVYSNKKSKFQFFKLKLFLYFFVSLEWQIIAVTYACMILIDRM